MFENLTNRMQDIFKRLRGRGRLGEKEVDEAVREIRLALLEADVNFKVVKEIVERIRQKAVGQEVLKSLTPAQQVVKIVHDELTDLMGGSPSKLAFASEPPTIIMLVGLQGSGKTSATAKLAYSLKSQGKRPLMVAADVYRPAAIDQLRILGGELDIPVTVGDKNERVLEICQKGISDAKNRGYDTVILDTAGRLHIDDEMMKELIEIKPKIRPHQVLLVADSMTGQDAVNQAKTFEEKLGLDGVILTKLDGDARGGAALSIKAVTGKPIKFVTVGEKPQSIELFYPDRMSSRILGMGDILTLIEKAEETVDREKAQALEQRLRKEEFNLEDFLDQMEQVKKMGSLTDILKMLPQGIVPSGLKGLRLEDKEIERVKAIIQSMTLEERRSPRTIDGSRRLRIAKGSGTSTTEVNKLLKQFEMMKKMVKQLTGGKLKFGKKGLASLFG
ncbi:MAG: signal recognition particle protein [Actinomycetota bacterium]